MTEVPAYRLNDGHSLPAIGLGTYPMKGEECTRAVLAALETGYRLIDSAVNYGNEDAVGEALRRTDVPREEIVVTTKLPGRHHGYAEAKASAAASAKALGVEQIGLYLIHWPNPLTDHFREAWRALVDLQRDGLVRSIGVSNFTGDHLRAVIEGTGVTPAVNQIELHPVRPQQTMRDEDEALGIRTESWSPLGRMGPEDVDNDVVRGIAREHDVTPGQVVLRWHVELGAVPLPKSANPQRQKENADIFRFSLSPDELSAIAGLSQGDGWSPAFNPDEHEEQ